MENTIVPKVSILVPAYNAEKYLETTIASVLNQTESNFEVIVVDDASTDKTSQIVRSFNDARVRLIVNSTNMGQGCSFQRALETATGEWIAVLDADDWFEPTRLEKMLSVGGATGADMVVDDLLFVSEDGKTQIGSRWTEDGLNVSGTEFVDATEFIQCKFLGVSTCRPGLIKPLIRHQFFLDHNITFPPHRFVTQDYVLFSILLMKGAQCVVIPDGYYYYRLHQNSMSHIQTTPKWREGQRQETLYLLQEPSIASHPVVSAYLKKYLKFVETDLKVWPMRFFLKSGQYQKALTHAMKHPDAIVLISFSVAKNFFRRITSA